MVGGTLGDPLEFVDVLDRLLDQGIVIGDYVRVSRVGIVLTGGSDVLGPAVVRLHLHHEFDPLPPLPGAPQSCLVPGIRNRVPIDACSQSSRFLRRA